MEGSKRKADDQDQNQNPNPFQQSTAGYNGGPAAKVQKLDTPQPQQQAPASRGGGATTRGGANNRGPTNNRGAPSTRRATTNQRGAGRGAQRGTPLGGQRGGQRGRPLGQRGGIRGLGRGFLGAGRGIPGVGRGMPGIGRGVPGTGPGPGILGAGRGRGQGRGRGTPNPPPLAPQPPQPPPQQPPQQFIPDQLPAQQNLNAQINPQLQPPAGPPVQRPPIPPPQQQATNFNTQWDQAAEARWLASSSTWEILGQPGWRGVKFLGRGGFGIIGLWQRNNIYYRKTESVVVKQHNMCLDLLENEAYYIQLLSEGGGTHTVRLIKGYWEGQGGGSGILDPDTRVGRIYLEFCENGDMDGFIKKMNSHYSADDPIPEELVWKIWLCLARAAVTLETGQEEITGDVFAPTSVVPVTHLDIKTENVLLGSLDNGPHKTAPIFKVADFGLALQHRIDNQNEENWNRTKLCGTDGWRAPEFTRIFDRYSKNIHKYGPWTNVWSLSKCIYHLLTRYQDVEEFHKTCVHDYDMYRIESAYTTYGANLKRYIPDGVYSEQLRNSLWHSIAREPGQRPRTKELLRNIILTLKWWDDSNQGDEDDEFWDYYDEPETTSNSDPNPMNYSRGMGDMTPGYRRDIDPVASLQVPEDMPDVDMGGI